MNAKVHACGRQAKSKTFWHLSFGFDLAFELWHLTFDSVIDLLRNSSTVR
jgi:hypothetical protein